MVSPVNSFPIDSYEYPIFFPVGLIHGDMAQFDRTQVITEFKKRDMPVLIATDVAGE